MLTSTRQGVLRFAPRTNEGLRFDAKRVRQPVDVIEVADDLRRIVDSAIGKRNGAEPVHIRRAHICRAQRQLFGKGAQGGIHRVEVSGMPVAGDTMDIRIGLRFAVEPGDLSTEVMRVGLRSVMAGVRLADDNRQQFALRP